MLISSILFLYGVPAIKFEAMVSNSALTVLHDSRQSTVNIRQCTCKEMNDGFEEAKEQAFECLMDPCFEEVKKMGLVQNTDVIRECFRQKKEFMNNLLLCFQNNIKACTPPGKQEKQVPSADLNLLIDRAEEVITQQLAVFLKTINASDIQKVGDAAKAVGRCVKLCFVNDKNKNGFRFDRIGCMPYITDRNARRSVRQCSRAINWKKEISEMCTCSAHAGIGTLANYCGIFTLMGR
ncbi:unnamed protein product, partial [Mesorhabditis spiculigera]